MPIYEYRCSDCNQLCELIQKFSDQPARECPHCGTQGLTRQISATSFHLKGTGWYVTDFKDKENKNQNNSPAATEKPDTQTAESTKTAETTQHKTPPTTATDKPSPQVTQKDN